MKYGIFLSYRREDASADARSIYQRLCNTFGKNQVFIDIDSIDRGKDFRAVLERNLDMSKVFVAVIGPHWMEVQDDKGSRRIDNTNDFVRFEIARALHRDITVIPVLVGKASLPNEADLPPDLRPLAFRQAALVRHESFLQDMGILERDIKKVIRINPSRYWLAFVFLLILAVFIFALRLSLPSGFWLPTNSIPTNISALMQQCVHDAVHPERTRIIANLRDELQKHSYRYGWRNQPGIAGINSDITWKTVTKIEATPEELKIAFDWREGELRLVPVLEATPTMDGALPALRLQGTWSQTNAVGCTEMSFDDLNSARGRWGSANPASLDREAFLEKLGTTNR